MPIYEYTCSSCGKLTDILQKVSDPAPGTCPQCNAEGTLSKLVSRTSFVLKGGGWYSDLYSSSKKDGGGSGGGSSGGASGGGSGTGTASTSSSSSTSGSTGGGSTGGGSTGGGSTGGGSTAATGT